MLTTPFGFEVKSPEEIYATSALAYPHSVT
jgi:hypothetical protein